MLGLAYQKTDGLTYFSCAIPVFPEILTQMTDVDLLWAGTLAVEAYFFPQAPLNWSFGFIFSFGLPGAWELAGYPLEPWQTQVWRAKAVATAPRPPLPVGWDCSSGFSFPFP